MKKSKQKQKERTARRSAQRQSDKRLRSLLARMEAGEEVTDAERLEASDLAVAVLIAECTKNARQIENAATTVEQVRRMGDKTLSTVVATAAQLVDSDSSSAELEAVRSQLTSALAGLEAAAKG